jgi:hypothetical protein
VGMCALARHLSLHCHAAHVQVRVPAQGPAGTDALQHVFATHLVVTD